jgi:hypothetical protein
MPRMRGAIPPLPNASSWFVESASELYRPSDRRLSAKVVPTFADRGRHVVSVTGPYGRILEFLDRSRYLILQVAPQLYSRGWVDPVPDPLLLRKSGSAGNRTRASGSVARNSYQWNTGAVYFLLHNIYIYIFIQFVPHRKHNTSPLCSKELWPLDHRGGLLSSTWHI